MKLGIYDLTELEPLTCQKEDSEDVIDQITRFRIKDKRP